ncbi:hypothetical protein BH24DEI2_BH24DEI2_09490 [soil metagenome]
MRTTVTGRGQTVIPSDIRKRYGITEGDTLVWLEDPSGIKVIPVPHDPVSALRGRGKGEKLTQALLTKRREDRTRE